MQATFYNDDKPASANGYMYAVKLLKKTWPFTQQTKTSFLSTVKESRQSSHASITKH